MQVTTGKLLNAIKIAAGCTIAIMVAYTLGLDYYVTAGIITILSIQNTKRETIQTAVNRGLAYIFALLIAAVCFFVGGYTIPAYGVFVLLFTFLCLVTGWREAIAMCSVLVSHFLMEQSMAVGWLINETLIFLIGVGFGILINLSFLRKKKKAFEQLAEQVDAELKRILERMAEQLVCGTCDGRADQCFDELEARLEAAKEAAIRNWNNSLRSRCTYEMDYIELRQKQSMVLKDIYKSMIRIEALTEQRLKVAGFIQEIVADYRRDNAVEGLLQSLKEVLSHMKDEKLPKTREEFEARAVLFYVLMQLEEFLLLKNQFVKKRIE